MTCGFVDTFAGDVVGRSAGGKGKRVVKGGSGQNSIDTGYPARTPSRS